MTVYIALFCQENQRKTEKSESHEEEEDHHYTLKESFMILADIFRNKNLQLYFLFRLALLSTISINASLGSVYLTNDVNKTFLISFFVVEIPSRKVINNICRSMAL